MLAYMTTLAPLMAAVFTGRAASNDHVNSAWHCISLWKDDERDFAPFLWRGKMQILLIKRFVHNSLFDWFVIDRDCDMNILLDFTDFVCNIDFVSCIRFVLCCWYNRDVICLLGFNSIICEIWNLQSPIINDVQMGGDNGQSFLIGR